MTKFEITQLIRRSANLDLNIPLELFNIEDGNEESTWHESTIDPDWMQIMQTDPSKLFDDHS